MGFFSSSRSPASSKNGKTIIAEGVRVCGELVELTGPLLVDGIVEGQIHSQGDVVIGTAGRVIGQINAQKVYINGVLKGSVSAKEVEILSQGQLYGDLLSGELIIEKGGRFQGNSHGLDPLQTHHDTQLLSNELPTEFNDEKDSK
jgi:cytoskeletal protein CcmA (bactofilin family)